MMDDYSEKKYYLIVADILSMITISSCFVIKIPQIRKIQQIKSAKGECWLPFVPGKRECIDFSYKND